MVFSSLTEALSHYQPNLLSETRPCAAVMVLLVTAGDSNIEIVLTKRAAALPTYAGDYSFPGGIKDTTDLDLHATAIRELNEELSIPHGAYQFLGQLDDFRDRFGNVVRPFVATMEKENFEKLHKIAIEEIAHVYYFPLQRIQELKDTPELHAITKRRPSYSFREENFFVWGLTAGILMHLWQIVNSQRSSQPFI